MATELDSSHSEIMSLWAEYREGIYEGDSDRLAKIFHDTASMVFVEPEGLVVRPVKEYLNQVRARPVPKKIGAARRERLVSIAIPSVDSAVLTATILVMGKSFTDQLVLMKVQGQWRIVLKTYHLDEELPN